jgi:hypothetical protein
MKPNVKQQQYVQQEQYVEYQRYVEHQQYVGVDSALSGWLPSKAGTAAAHKHGTISAKAGPALVWVLRRRCQ